jgi:hypothetical protein
MRRVRPHRFRLLLAYGLVPVVYAGLAGETRIGRARAEEATHRWFSVPVEVRGLPAGAEFVPVSTFVDFTELQKRLGAPGAVDEHSLRLYRVLPGGAAAEEPLQFSAALQPRPKTRGLLPGTTPAVSYVAEYRAGETPPLRTAGKLAWIVRAGTGPVRRYRLEFGVPRAGRMIQVPYLPEDLHAFDAQGRATPIRYFPRMQIHPQWPLDGAVQISECGRLITSYHLGPSPAQAAAPALPLRRPFFYPLIGPDGVGLTEFGKAHDPTGSHAHHYSLWVAHANVAGEDFWSEKGGLIAHQQFEVQEDGPIFARLVQTTRWISHGLEYLHERRSITVYQAAGDFRLMDVELEFSPAAAKPVELGKTSFGFLALRVAQSMTPFDGGGEILNARGDRNEQSVHTRRAEWLDQSGPIAPGVDEGAASAAVPPVRWGGIALMDHPSNRNHPTAWHCRNDGWAGASFNIDGPYAIAAGATLRLAYRVHLHRHNAVAAMVARRYEEYRAEPAIHLGEPAAVAGP